MEPNRRYEIREKIGTGDFATVYRARDRELGREVAIKQIHPQFLEDPQSTARYWHEAQLLASLQHPHVMAIYDVDKNRGWLVVELMQGTLAQYTKGEPMPVELLSRALLQALRALRFLHKNGVIHGDIKPSNLLLDKKLRVKIGDFGLARRATGAEGSLLKGTTKYMAPELLSDEMGEPGPHSDLYSLGFCAYELLCGRNFEQLFPGLETFGRDKQIAWMMWHAARDRRLPDIQQVLEGVPEDVAFVIQRLCQKDPNKRYRTADEAIQDIKVGPETAAQIRQEEEQLAETQAGVAKKKQWLTYGAIGLSVLLTLGIVFAPSGPPPKPPEIPVIDGYLREATADRLVIEQGNERIPKPVTLTGEVQIRLANGDKYILPDEIAPGDYVAARTLPGKSDQAPAKVQVYVSKPTPYQGKLTSVRPAEGDRPGQIAWLITEGEKRGSESVWRVPPTTAITINKQTSEAGQTYTLAQLKAEDTGTAEIITTIKGEEIATAIAVLQERTVKGTVRGTIGGLLFSVGDDPTTPPQPALPLSDTVTILLNGRQTEPQSGRAYTISDLQAGDKVTVVHDIVIHRISATR